MARDTLVTAESVFNAADRLMESAVNPSLRAVRKELGGGSFGTILPFLQSWRRARGLDTDDEQPVDLSALPPAVAAALDRMANATQELTDAVQQEFGRDDADTGPTQEEMRAEVVKLQEMAVEQISKLRAERDDLIAMLTEARQELTTLKEWRRNAVEHMRALGTKIAD